MLHHAGMYIPQQVLITWSMTLGPTFATPDPADMPVTTNQTINTTSRGNLHAVLTHAKYKNLII